MALRTLLVAAMVAIAGGGVIGDAQAQREFPLTGRWTYFDYGTRAAGPGELNDFCMSSWDSYTPDGGFIGFEMDSFGVVSAVYAGYCVAFGNEISCEYLLDSEVGPINDPEDGELSFYSTDIVDYILHDASGKPDYANSWTYIRCPASAGFSVG